MVARKIHQPATSDYRSQPKRKPDEMKAATPANWGMRRSMGLNAVQKKNRKSKLVARSPNGTDARLASETQT